ncbi:MAG: trypsin-like peptidase domain-containing protein [bacterium]
MRIYRWFLVVFIVLLSCFTFSPISLAEEKLPGIVKNISSSVVVVLTYDSKGEILTQGSGFFISQNGDVITNRHVLQGASRAEVKTTKGQIYPVKKIVAEDIEGDIIRLSVDIPVKVATLPLTGSVPEVGEQVLVIGSPLGLEQTVSDGIVSAVREIPEFGKIIQITAPISSGSSGNPVVNMKGEVIGVASFLIIEGQNLNFAIPTERIKKLTLDKGKTLAEWEESTTEEEIASAEELYSTGLTFLWAEDYEKALSYFEEAVKTNPDYAEAYFQIGYCNGELDRYQEAIASYQQAIRINPDLAEVHYNLGVVYLLLGDRGSALDEYKVLKDLDKDMANKLFNLIYE